MRKSKNRTYYLMTTTPLLEPTITFDPFADAPNIETSPASRSPQQNHGDQLPVVLQEEYLRRLERKLGRIQSRAMPEGAPLRKGSAKALERLRIESVGYAFVARREEMRSSGLVDSLSDASVLDAGGGDEGGELNTLLGNSGRTLGESYGDGSNSHGDGDIGGGDRGCLSAKRSEKSYSYAGSSSESEASSGEGDGSDEEITSAYGDLEERDETVSRHRHAGDRGGDYPDEAACAGCALQ